MTVLYYREVESPVGELVLCASESGICNLAFGKAGDVLPVLNRWAQKQFGASALEADPHVLNEAARQLEEYFGGRRKAFELPLDLRGTPFQQKVWSSLARIPYGEVRSYKQVAEDIGSPKAVRAVGGANNRNPLAIIIPCHRVIGTDGTMTGYGGGLHVKHTLLRHEGYLTS